jgi:hypothetical protein
MNWINRTVLATAALVFAGMSASEATAQPTLSGGATGNTITVQWTSVVGATSYNIVVTGAAAIDVAIPAAQQSTGATGVPAGTYNIRVRAMFGATPGPFSNQLAIAVGGASPPPGGCPPLDAPVANAAMTGGSVTATWTAVIGAAGYRLNFGMNPGGNVYQTDVPAAQTSFVAPIPQFGTFYFRVSALTACGVASVSNEVAFTNAAPPPPPGPRTPDPPAGQLCDPSRPHYGACIPTAVAETQLNAALSALAGPYNFELQNSCTEHGGNNAFLMRALNLLRAQFDTRWGLNNKRGHIGGRSEDVLAYNPTSQPDQGARQIYLYDVFVNHCPITGSVIAGVNNVTFPTWYGGSRELCARDGRPDFGGTWCARWTLNWAQ